MPTVKLITNHFKNVASAKKHFDKLPPSALAKVHVSISEPAEHPVYGLPKLAKNGNYFYEMEVDDCYQGTFDLSSNTVEIICGIDLAASVQISDDDNEQTIKEAIYLTVKKLLTDNSIDFNEIIISSPIWLGYIGTWYATIKKNK